MYSKPRLAFKWLKYFFHASNSRGHGIHSPFVYKMIREVFNDRKSYDAYERIERLKRKLLRDRRNVQVRDLGAGSYQNNSSVKMVSDIAGQSVSSRKFGRLLFRLASYYQAERIFELGSSLGISTAYLAAAREKSNILTIEGSPEITTIAEENFRELGLKNIVTVTGDFEDVLPDAIHSNPPADFVFIDGNHRKKPVLEYFDRFVCKISPQALIIIHDIHWSPEMEEAWTTIQADPRVKMSIDIFSAGLVFFREEFKVKQKFVIRF